MFATFLQPAALVILLLSQLALGALPAKEYNGRYVVRLDAGIGGYYPGAGAGLENSEIAQLAKDAMLDARAIARETSISVPKTLAVYINPQGDLVLAGSGGQAPGAGRTDAEKNLLNICTQQGIPFSGGKIVSWNFDYKYFIRACADCMVILQTHGGIVDMFEEFEEFRG